MIQASSSEFLHGLLNMPAEAVLELADLEQVADHEIAGWAGRWAGVGGERFNWTVGLGWDGGAALALG